DAARETPRRLPGPAPTVPSNRSERRVEAAPPSPLYSPMPRASPNLPGLVPVRVSIRQLIAASSRSTALGGCFRRPCSRPTRPRPRAHRPMQEVCLVTPERLQHSTEPAAHRGLALAVAPLLI